MNKPTLIRTGFDTIEYAIPASYPPEFYLCLENAKSLAVASRKPHPTQYNGTHFFVQANGGQGGYEFQIDTGPFGFQMKIRSRNLNDNWTTHVKMLAHGLASKGAETLKSECAQFLSTIGARFNHENMRINRLDYALDFYTPGLVVSSTEIIAHARTAKSEHIERTTIGDRPTYLRVGKTPNQQVCIYDKSKAITDKRDLKWRDIYRRILSDRSIDYHDKDIWRVEFRAGKNAIEKYAKPRFFETVMAVSEVMYLGISHNIRWAVSDRDTNRSRWRPHPIWVACQKHFKEDFNTHEPVTVSEATKAQLAQEHISQLEAQSEGLTLTLAAAFGIEPRKMGDFVQAHFTKLGRRLGARADLEDQLRTRKERHALMFGR